MTLTFDLFTKKTRFYYIGIIISVFAGLFIGALTIFDNPNYIIEDSFLDYFLDALIIIFTFFTLTFLLLVGYGAIRTYIKDGELVLADDYIIIDGTKIMLTEAKDLSFKVGYRNYKRPGKIVSNRISVIDNNGVLHNRRFVIQSRDNTTEFDAIAAKWVKDGIDFGLIYTNIG